MGRKVLPTSVDYLRPTLCLELLAVGQRQAVHFGVMWLHPLDLSIKCIYHKNSKLLSNGLFLAELSHCFKFPDIGFDIVCFCFLLPTKLLVRATTALTKWGSFLSCLLDSYLKSLFEPTHSHNKVAGGTYQRQLLTSLGLLSKVGCERQLPLAKWCLFSLLFVRLLFQVGC